MTAAIIGLTTVYAALALLLLSLHLRSSWAWPVKAFAIGAVLPAFAGTFMVLETSMGWPSDTALPPQFQLHAALVDEPTGSDGGEGAIFLWLTPWDAMMKDAATDQVLTLDAAPEPADRPRAFDLPYSRDLHRQVDAMRERLRNGELVTGSYRGGSAWKRRLGQQDGVIDLEAPPAPPPPSKEG